MGILFYEFNISSFIIVFFPFIINISYEAPTQITKIIPNSFTLSDNSIVLITNDGIHFYDESLTSENEGKSISFELSNNDLSTIAMAQFPNDEGKYILILVKYNLYIFNEEKTNIKSENISSLLNTENEANYCIMPYKKESNYLNFFISYKVLYQNLIKIVNIQFNLIDSNTNLISNIKTINS